MAAHILGNIDSGVKPGIVLISLTTSDPSGITKKSTLARPSQLTASNVRAASARSRSVTSSGSFAGTFDGGRVEARVVKRNVRWVMWRLEALRAKLGDHPIGINSAFRSVAYNQCIGGVSLSQHMYGTAVDFKVLDVANRAARDAGKSSQFHGIACYSSLTHNHFDLRLQNKELEAAHYWWWPKRDKLERDLADDDRPCWGEPKKEPGEQHASSAVMSGAALDEWKNAFEPFLNGAD